MKIILCFIGPGGSGKTFLLSYLKEMFYIPEIKSTVTRKMRKGESEGNPYHFISEKEFNPDNFIEFIERKSGKYGTTRNELVKKFKNNNLVLTIVEKNGLKQLKEKTDYKIITIYIHCSEDEAFERMIKRGDNKKKVKKRIKEDKENNEYLLFHLADHVIPNYNGNLENAKKRILKLGEKYLKEADNK